MLPPLSQPSHHNPNTHRKTRCQASRIVTSTPEKSKIEMEGAKKISKPLKDTQPKTKCRKNLTKSLKKEAKMDSSSSEVDSDAVSTGESSEYYESPDEDPSALLPLNGQYELLKPGTFVLVKFVGGTRKATVFMFVCSIQKVPHQANGSSEVEVMGFVSQDRERKIFIPREDDLSFVPERDILAVLPDPVISIKGERIQYVFKNPIMDVKEH